MNDLYTYRISKLERVVDGDTFDLHLDCGFHLTFASRFRLNGYDCPETRRGSEFEREKGAEATEAAIQWFAEHQPLHHLRVVTHKADSFGRWLADITALDEDRQPVSRLGEHLMGLGLAVEWPKRWNEVYDRPDDVDHPDDEL